MSKTVKTKDQRPGPGWFSREAAAEVFGVQVGQIDSRHAKLDPSAVQRVGRRVWLYLAKIIDAKEAEAVEKAKLMCVGDEALLSGADSPSLERLRLATARLKEMDLEERAGSHVALAVLEALAQRIGSKLRQRGEVRQRKYGAQAADIHNETLDDMLAALEEASAEIQNTKTQTAGNPAKGSL